MKNRFGFILILMALFLAAACLTNPALENIKQGDIYLEVKQWDKAIAEYGKAMNRPRTNSPIPNMIRPTIIAATSAI